MQNRARASPGAEPARRLLTLQILDAALQIGGEMPSIALPQDGVAPVIPSHAAATARRAAGAIELVIGRAVAHRIIDGDLLAGPDRPHRDDGDLPRKARIRVASVVDVVGKLVSGERGKIEAFLDLHGMPPDLRRQLFELLGGYEPPAPHGDNLAGLDQNPSEYGLAAGDITISDFAFIGEVSRCRWAHETSARARR